MQLEGYLDCFEWFEGKTLQQQVHHETPEWKHRRAVYAVYVLKLKALCQKEIPYETTVQHFFKVGRPNKNVVVKLRCHFVEVFSFSPFKIKAEVAKWLRTEPHPQPHPHLNSPNHV